MGETNKTIITVGLVFSFVVNSLMFGWEATRRTADDLVKIASVDIAEREAKRIETQRRADECIKAGGVPDYYGDIYEKCNK